MPNHLWNIDDGDGLSDFDNWLTYGELIVGGGGTFDSGTAGPAPGVLNISEGGTVNVVAMAISAWGDSSHGSVNIQGTNSTLTSIRGISVAPARSGTGSLHIARGGSASARNLYIGDSGNGTVTVMGSESTLNAKSMSVGSQPHGNGFLEVTDGAIVTMDQSGNEDFCCFSIANNQGSTGTVNVNGIGSHLRITGTNFPSWGNGSGEAPWMTIGSDSGNGTETIGGGTGTLVISQGGKVSLEQDIYDPNQYPGMNIARQGDSTGTVVVRDAGSILEIGHNGFISVGRRTGGAHGTIHISNGGLLAMAGTNGHHPGMRLARTAGTSGVLVIDGDDAGVPSHLFMIVISPR